MTVQPAPGCTQNQVAFNSIPTSGGLRTQNIHLKNLTITGIQLSTSTTINGSLPPMMWYDNVVQTGAGQTAGGNPTNNFTSEWYNDSDLSSMTAGPAPVLARNVTIHDMVVKKMWPMRTLLWITLRSHLTWFSNGNTQR
jgi:hypothetical protein